MAFAIEWTASAISHLQSYRKYEQKIVLDAADEQLAHQPNVETRNRKRLGDNVLATWELRVRNYRIFYGIVLNGSVLNDSVLNDSGNSVKIKAVGHKEHNRLFIGDKEFEL